MENVRSRFDKAISEEYYRHRSPPADRMAKDLELFRERMDKFNKILDADPEFYVLSRCANMTATWFSMLSAVIIEELKDADENSETLDEQVAGLSFFSRLASDLWAIIELVELGFDLQARALTRSYLEHIDVLICCINDRALTKEFIESVEPQQSNAFWHRYVSKNRAKEKVSRIIGSMLGEPNYRIVDLLREDAELAGSTLLHPTMAAGLAAAFGHEDGDYDSYPIFPTPLPASIGIFRTILIHHLWLSLVMEALPTASGGDWRALLHSKQMLENKELSRFGGLYSKMFKFLLDNELLMKSDN